MRLGCSYDKVGGANMNRLFFGSGLRVRRFYSLLMCRVRRFIQDSHICVLPVWGFFVFLACSHDGMSSDDVMSSDDG
jgi:hypothetical protein